MSRYWSGKCRRNNVSRNEFSKNIRSAILKEKEKNKSKNGKQYISVDIIRFYLYNSSTFFIWIQPNSIDKRRLNAYLIQIL